MLWKIEGGRTRLHRVQFIWDINRIMANNGNKIEGSKNLSQREGAHIMVRTSVTQGEIYLVDLELTSRMSDTFLMLTVSGSGDKTPHTT
jgi:hypothetical protein